MPTQIRQTPKAGPEANASVDHQNNEQITALNAACYDGHEECALLLLRAGSCGADVADKFGDTPHTIAQGKGLEKVLALM